MINILPDIEGLGALFKRVRRPWVRVVITFWSLLAGFLVIPPAMALQDVLETPSMPTRLATESLLLDVARAGNAYVAVGERGHVIYSTDEGKTWTQAAVPVSTTLTAVYFVDGQHGWAVGHGGVILSSSDGGKTWTKQFDGYLANQMVIKQAENQLAEIQARLDAAPEEEKADIEYELEDAQYALDDAKADAEAGPSKPMLDVWFKDEMTGYVVGAYGFFFKTSDGGKNWENWAPNLDNPDRFHLNAINYIKGDVLFIVGEAGQIFRSLDLGDSWERLESPYDGSFFGVVGTENVHEALAFGLRGHIFRTSDMGNTWDAVDSGTDASLLGGTSGRHGNVTLVGQRGVVAVSTDGGNSFIAKERSDRLALTAVIQRNDGALLLFGEKGVVIANSKGRNIK